MTLRLPRGDLRFLPCLEWLENHMAALKSLHSRRTIYRTSYGGHFDHIRFSNGNCRVCGFLAATSQNLNKSWLVRLPCSCYNICEQSHLQTVEPYGDSIICDQGIKYHVEKYNSSIAKNKWNISFLRTQYLDLNNLRGIFVTCVWSVESASASATLGLLCFSFKRSFFFNLKYSYFILRFLLSANPWPAELRYLGSYNMKVKIVQKVTSVNH